MAAAPVAAGVTAVVDGEPTATVIARAYAGAAVDTPLAATIAI